MIATRLMSRKSTAQEIRRVSSPTYGTFSSSLIWSAVSLSGDSAVLLTGCARRDLSGLA